MFHYLKLISKRIITEIDSLIIKNNKYFIMKFRRFCDRNRLWGGIV